MKQPAYPSLYQINTREWGYHVFEVHELSIIVEVDKIIINVNN